MKTTFTANELNELNSVIDSNVNIWNRPISSITITDRFVKLIHPDGRYTEYRWDGEELRLL